MQQLDPKAVWLFFIKSLLSWIFIFVAAYILLVGPLSFLNPIPSQFQPYIGTSVEWLIWVILFIALDYIWAKLTYHFYRYKLSTDGFKKEHGVIYFVDIGTHDEVYRK